MQIAGIYSICSLQLGYQQENQDITFLALFEIMFVHGETSLSTVFWNSELDAPYTPILLNVYLFVCLWNLLNLPKVPRSTYHRFFLLAASTHLTPPTECLPSSTSRTLCVLAMGDAAPDERTV